MKKTIIIFGIILSILLIKSNTNAASVYQTQAEQQINNGQVQYSQQQAQATTQQVNENGETAQAVSPFSLTCCVVACACCCEYCT